MKIQCLECKEIVPIGPFEILSDRIRVSCAECGATFEVAPQADAAPRSSASARTPPDTAASASSGCPKCGTTLIGAAACKVCGLEARYFDEYRDRAVGVASPALDAAWAACLAEWDDGARHEELLTCASLEGELGAAARRYRLYLGDHPGDERASAALERLTRMAAATMLQRPRVEPAGEEPYKKVVLLLMALLLLGGMGGVYLLVKRAMAPASAGATEPVPPSGRVTPPGRGGQPSPGSQDARITGPTRRSP